MSMEPAIRVENLSKCYRIGTGPRGEYRTLSESITEAATAPWRRLRDLSGRRSEKKSKSSSHIWALQDISFEIKPGEVVGIIGRNGAGKSTLLKILSRITEPTSGRAEYRGRVASLLEVGTGFHTELTGRENIYLNGSILGMSRTEIRRKFDKISAFSEIETFLDTPVKRYSSGMYVRLAFAVAAHLDPEILIVDEVLAVGDATYQKRCIDHMAQIARSGRTVIFVSHNMDLIPRLCQGAILMNRGRIIEMGNPRDVIDCYLAEMLAAGDGEDLTGQPRLSGDGRARFTGVRLIGNDGKPRTNFACGDDLRLRIRIMARQEIANVAVGVHLQTLGGTRILTGWTRECGFPVSLRPGDQVLDCRFRGVRIRPGQRITASFWMESGTYLDHIENAWTFDVADGDETSTYSTDKYLGVLLSDYEWSGPMSPASFGTE